MTNKSTIICPDEIRIGTRGSALAIAQAEEVKLRLLNAFPEQLSEERIHIIKIMTTGDRVQDRTLVEIGGKGLFTKEIEEALFRNEVDIAVHSMKDMTDTLPDGLVINCILEREDPRDAWLSPIASSIEALPEGAVVGTASTRRQAQLLAIRPDLKIVPFRGNINTRMRKLDDGEVDATLLAIAGLKRINMQGKITTPIETDIMLPAVAQGAIGIESLVENTNIHNMLRVINHPQSEVRIKAERTFLKILGGSCSTPIGGLAEYTAYGNLHFRGIVASPDGTETYQVESSASPDNAESLGIKAGEEMLAKAGHLLSHCRQR